MRERTSTYHSEGSERLQTLVLRAEGWRAAWHGSRYYMAHARRHNAGDFG